MAIIMMAFRIEFWLAWPANGRSEIVAKICPKIVNGPDLGFHCDSQLKRLANDQSSHIA